MSTIRHSVMLVSLEGPTQNLANAVNSALEAGLDPVVLVPATAVVRTRQMLDEQLESESWPRVTPLRVHTFGGLRGGIRRAATRGTSFLGRSMRRVVRVLRVRTGFGRRRGASLMRLEPRIEAIPTKIASAVIRALVDAPLALLGRGITESRNIVALRRMSLQLQREGMLIGVVCLDGKALIPGWYIARMSPSTPVLTGYPDDWNRRLLSEIERFENGPKWI
ncbi:hypothetical protein BH23ACT4_BH23ACT4_07520 [soil metagenome]